MNIKQLKNKKIILAYSDPGGAKIILSIAHLLNKKNDITVLSNREFDFIEEFSINVKVKKTKEAIEFIKNKEFDILISGTSYTNDFELDIINFCKSKQILTCIYVDNWSGFDVRLKRGLDITIPDRTYVIDNIAKKNAIDFGLKIDSIHILDNPYWQYLKSWKPKTIKQNLFNKYSLSTKKKTIYIAPDPLSNVGGIKRFGFDEYTAVKEILSKIDINKFNLIIKPHPNQNIELLNKILLNSHCTIITNNNNHNHLIHYSDLVISFFSNILIEAKYLDTKPLRYIEELISEDLFKDKSIEVYNKKEQIDYYI